jgi:hypothetical protein
LDTTIRIREIDAAFLLAQLKFILIDFNAEMPRRGKPKGSLRD